MPVPVLVLAVFFFACNVFTQILTLEIYIIQMYTSELVYTALLR